jgi:acid phosphatase (class A)
MVNAAAKVFSGRFVIVFFLLHALTANAWEVHDPVYLSPNFFDGQSPGQTLPAVPSHNSAQEKADFKQLLNLQKTRTPQDCERARYEVRINLDTDFGPKYGPLTEKEVIAWSAFFGKLGNEAGYFTQKAKKIYHRPRPYITEPKLHPCIQLEATDAYPSGHTTLSRVFARVLSELDPSRSAAFIARGNQIAEDRVLGGVHHPSDIEAGKMLGDEIFAALIKSKKFNDDLNVLKR